MKLSPSQTDILTASALFSGIKKEDALSMMHCLGAEKRRALKGEYIFMEGDPAGKIGFILSGSVRILRDSLDGTRTILAVADTGSLFAEAFACAGVREMPVSVEAQEDTDLLLLNVSKMLTTCSKSCSFHQSLIRNLLMVVARKNLQMNRKLRILAHKTTREKLLAYLEEQAGISRSRSFSIPLDRQALADYLGVERSAMSAELGKLQREGVLSTRKNYFELH